MKKKKIITKVYALNSERMHILMLQFFVEKNYSCWCGWKFQRTFAISKLHKGYFLCPNMHLFPSLKNLLEFLFTFLENFSFEEFQIAKKNDYFRFMYSTSPYIYAFANKTGFLVHFINQKNM